MATNDYHFVTRWQIPAPADTIFEILATPLDLPRWWPSVYLGVTKLKAGDDTGIGSQYGLYTKGWLPYTLRWSFVVTEADRPTRMALTARGDFVGRGVWTLLEQKLTDREHHTEVTYEWTVSATKGLLRRFSFLFKPVFAANHRWAMARGEESLLLELERRGAISSAGSVVPDPPGPTFSRLIRDKA